MGLPSQKCLMSKSEMLPSNPSLIILVQVLSGRRFGHFARRGFFSSFLGLLGTSGLSTLTLMRRVVLLNSFDVICSYNVAAPDISEVSIHWTIYKSLRTRTHTQKRSATVRIPLVTILYKVA